MTWVTWGTEPNEGAVTLRVLSPVLVFLLPGASTSKPVLLPVAIHYGACRDLPVVYHLPLTATWVEQDSSQLICTIP
jgi:hypothetical protein